MADLGTIGASGAVLNSSNTQLGLIPTKSNIGTVLNSSNVTLQLIPTKGKADNPVSAPRTEIPYMFLSLNVREPESKLMYTSSLKSYFGTMTCSGERMVLGGKDITDGNPTQPSLRMDNGGMWRFRWKVASGTRTIAVNVKQALNQSPRPTLVVKANSDIGISADVSGSAAASTGWVQIGPVTVTPTGDGAVWVELHNNVYTMFGQGKCYWDHIVTT